MPMPISLPLLPLGSWFPHENWPRLPCGECTTGELLVGTPSEIDMSAPWRDHPGWEPEWINGHFSVEATCTNRDCRSIALIAGKMKVDVDVDENGHWYGAYDTFYEMRYSDPPLRLLVVPEGAPDDVKRAIVSAGQVVWLDPASGANRLRTAVEHLLTDLGVPKRGSAHRRIERLAESEPDVAEVLEAVKWIGNDGSHTTAVSLKDVLEGVALLERALNLCYDNSAAELTCRAREINAERRTRRST